MPIPTDIRDIRTPVAPPTTFSVKVVATAQNTSGWTALSASTKHRISPVAIAAPPFLAAAIIRFSTVTTRQPRSRAMVAVLSVDPLSATITSTVPGYRSRATSTESRSAGRNLSSLYAGIINEISRDRTFSIISVCIYSGLSNGASRRNSRIMSASFSGSFTPMVPWVRLGISRISTPVSSRRIFSLLAWRNGTI